MVTNLRSFLEASERYLRHIYCRDLTMEGGYDNEWITGYGTSPPTWSPLGP